MVEGGGEGGAFFERKENIVYIGRYSVLTYIERFFSASFLVIFVDQ